MGIREAEKQEMARFSKKLDASAKKLTDVTTSMKQKGQR